MPALPASGHFKGSLGVIRENLLQRGDGKKILLLGMGNFLRGDDGFGPWVIRHLKDKTSLMLLDAGANPENMFVPDGGRPAAPVHVAADGD